MEALEKQGETYLYRQVIDVIGEKIETGALRPGDRLPSLRKMSKSAGVSVPTVRQAYVELERAFLDMVTQSREVLSPREHQRYLRLLGTLRSRMR